MTRVATPPTVQKQLLAVAEKLDDERVTGRKRLDLLRKQAELGDRRDQAVVDARRDLSDHR